MGRGRTESARPAARQVDLGYVFPVQREARIDSETWYLNGNVSPGCWILGRLTAASRSREAAALAAADHVLARTDEVPFEDFVAVENLLLQTPRAPHSDSSVLDVSPLLQFWRLQIPDRAARAPAGDRAAPGGSRGPLQGQRRLVGQERIR
jgi:hypothetical protein